MPPNHNLKDDDEIEPFATLKAKVYEWECPHCELWNDEADNGRDTVTCNECGWSFTVGQVVQGAIAVKQLAFDLIVYDREWKPCRFCKYANGGSCGVCFGKGGYYVLRLSRVSGEAGQEARP